MCLLNYWWLHRFVSGRIESRWNLALLSARLNESTDESRDSCPCTLGPIVSLSKYITTPRFKNTQNRSRFQGLLQLGKAIITHAIWLVHVWSKRSFQRFPTASTSVGIFPSATGLPSCPYTALPIAARFLHAREFQL